MYISFNIYRVAANNVAAFVRIQGAAARIYLREGALEDATYAPAGDVPMYGCVPLADAIELDIDEVILLGISVFNDRAHHDEVMARVDTDPEINRLFDEVASVIDLGRVLRGAFERVA